MASLLNAPGSSCVDKIHVFVGFSFVPGSKCSHSMKFPCQSDASQQSFFIYNTQTFDFYFLSTLLYIVCLGKWIFSVGKIKLVSRVKLLIIFIFTDTSPYAIKVGLQTARHLLLNQAMDPV